MDIGMPRLDGLAATRLIKAELSEIKIVVLTMSAEDSERLHMENRVQVIEYARRTGLVR